MLILDLTFDNGAILYTRDGPILVHVCRGTNADGHAKLGFDAPATVKILREELVRRKPGGVPPTHSLAEPSGNPG